MLTDRRRTDDGWTTDAGVTGILIAHLGAFGSGELKIMGKKILKILPENFYLSKPMTYHNMTFPHVRAIALFQPYTATGKLKAVITPTIPRGFHCSKRA